jgi:hypothetical protein
MTKLLTGVYIEQAASERKMARRFAETPPMV